MITAAIASRCMRLLESAGVQWLGADLPHERGDGFLGGIVTGDRHDQRLPVIARSLLPDLGMHQIEPFDHEGARAVGDLLRQ